MPPAGIIPNPKDAHMGANADTNILTDQWKHSQKQRARNPTATRRYTTTRVGQEVGKEEEGNPKKQEKEPGVETQQGVDHPKTEEADAEKEPLKHTDIEAQAVVYHQRTEETDTGKELLRHTDTGNAAKAGEIPPRDTDTAERRLMIERRDMREKQGDKIGHQLEE